MKLILFLLFIIHAVHTASSRSLKPFCKHPCKRSRDEMSFELKSAGFDGEIPETRPNTVNFRMRTIVWHRLTCEKSDVEYTKDWVQRMYVERGSGLEYVFRYSVVPVESDWEVVKSLWHIFRLDESISDFHGVDLLHVTEKPDEDVVNFYKELLESHQTRETNRAACLNSPIMAKMYEKMESTSPVQAPLKKNRENGWWLTKEEDVARFKSKVNQTSVVVWVYLAWRREMPVWQLEPVSTWNPCPEEASQHDEL